MSDVKRKIKSIKRSYVDPVLVNGKQKIFCIGRNKTGTTSLRRAALDLGFIVGDQPTAELLFKDYLKRDFSGIIKYCKTAQFFQDIPFSLPYTYQHLDMAFPGSKFILTVRDSPEQWYNSFIRFQKKINGENGQLPSKEELIKNPRVFEGFAYWTKNDVYRTPDDDLYNKEILLNHYSTYIEEVRHYFRFRNNLLILNVSQKGAFQEFCDFVGVKSDKQDFPWENKTENI